MTGGSGGQAADVSGPPTILFVVTEDWYFWSHRKALAEAAMAAGMKVALAARFTAHRARIESLGVRCFPFAVARATRRPWSDLRAMMGLPAIIRASGACLVQAVALKPILLCLVACWRLPTVSFCLAVTGLGHLFIASTLRARLLRAAVLPLLRLVMNRHNSTVVVQNSDDQALLRRLALGAPGRTQLIKGSGVDTARFECQPLPETALPLVVLPARMLRDKGVVEFTQAAAALRARGVRARCALVGGLDAASPSALTAAGIEALCRDSGCEWWGPREDMLPVLQAAAVVCLPSRREGLPKALLEAASCGRPLVATDVPGCREICRHGETGLLVPADDAAALAGALATLLGDPALCARLGARGRALAVAEFGVASINRQFLALYDALRAE